MNEQQQQAIFEPFVQLGEGRPAHTGTGLGLSICRQLAEMMNGNLTVESQPGEGSTFIFRFNAQTCEQSIAPEKRNLPAGVNESKHILIVDDHAPNRLLLSQQLEYAGYKVSAVESGQQALIAWEETLPDIVITDCNMHGMDGFELVRRLRQKETENELVPRAIYGLTAMAEHEVRVRAAAAGMTDCLFKPIDLATLLKHMSGDDHHHVTETQLAITAKLKALTKNNGAAFDDMVKTIIEQNQQDLAALYLAFEQHDLARIKHVAHQILGGARLIDDLELAEICRAIMLDASEQTWPRIKAGIEKCNVSIRKIERELQWQQQREK
jgi:two-component system sensor histidine kinase EvgS